MSSTLFDSVDYPGGLQKQFAKPKHFKKIFQDITAAVVIIVVLVWNYECRNSVITIILT